MFIHSFIHIMYLFTMRISLYVQHTMQINVSDCDLEECGGD